jgi:hypothetical protein
MKDEKFSIIIESCGSNEFHISLRYCGRLLDQIVSIQLGTSGHRKLRPFRIAAEVEKEVSKIHGSAVFYSRSEADAAAITAVHALDRILTQEREAMAKKSDSVADVAQDVVDGAVETVSGAKKLFTKLTETLKDAGTEGAKRGGVSVLVEAAREPVLGLLKRKKLPGPLLRTFTKALDTDIGRAAFGATLGVAGILVLDEKKSPRQFRVAKEAIAQGVQYTIATVGHEVIAIVKVVFANAEQLLPPMEEPKQLEQDRSVSSGIHVEEKVAVPKTNGKAAPV